MIKLNCCTDTHSAIPPNLDETDVLAWLHGGDVYSHLFFHKEPATPTFMALKEWVAARKAKNVSVYGVKGNHDCSFKMSFFDDAVNITGSCTQIAPKLNLIGLGWSGGAYYDLPTERDMQKVCDEAKRLWIMKSMPGDSTIILTHYPAWRADLYPDAGDPEGWLFTCIRELIDEVAPMAVIQGHIHQLFGKQFDYRPILDPSTESGKEFTSLFVYPGDKGGTLSIDLENSSVSFEFAGKKKKKDPKKPNPEHPA